jgi:hypothetical protein
MGAVHEPLLSIIAILLGVAGIWRSERLFKKLDNNLNHLMEDMKDNTLRQAITVTVSYAAFTRALQAVELDPMELPKDGAFALLTAFQLQKLLNTDFTPEQLAELRTLTRESVDKNACRNVDQLIKSGMGKLKDGVELNDLSGAPK